MEKENKTVELKVNEVPFIDEDDMMDNLLKKAGEAGIPLTKDVVEFINTANYDYLVEKGIAVPTEEDEEDYSEIDLHKALNPNLRDEFDYDAHDKVAEGYNVLVTACKLPSGAIEVAVNYDKLKEKVDYIHHTYDEDFKLKSNPEIQIVGYILL